MIATEMRRHPKFKDGISSQPCLWSEPRSSEIHHAYFCGPFILWQTILLF